MTLSLASPRESDLRESKAGMQTSFRDLASEVINLQFLRKLKIELPYDPAIPLLGIYPDKSIIQKDTCTPMFTAALFTIAKTWKQPKRPSTDEWIKKICIYTMEYYSAIKKNKIMPFAATWMQLEIMILSEVSQKEKDKYHMISLICGI